MGSAVAVSALYASHHAATNSIAAPVVDTLSTSEGTLVAALTRELSALKHELRTREEAPVAPTRDEASSASEPAAEFAPPMPPSPERLQARSQELAEYLDAHLINQAPDRVWQRDADAQIRTSVKILGADVQLETLDCGERLCRAAFAPGISTDLRSTLDRMTQVPPFNTSGFVRFAGEGATERASVYFVKSGTELPALPD